jgi:hypothetical protein
MAIAKFKLDRNEIEKKVPIGEKFPPGRPHLKHTFILLELSV